MCGIFLVRLLQFRLPPFHLLQFLLQFRLQMFRLLKVCPVFIAPLQLQTLIAIAQLGWLLHVPCWQSTSRHYRGLPQGLPSVYSASTTPDTDSYSAAILLGWLLHVPCRQSTKHIHLRSTKAILLFCILRFIVCCKKCSS